MTRATPAEELEARVRAALAGVMDPEIPTVSIVDLGLVERIEVTEAGVAVDLLPTFAGCPALDAIRDEAEAAVRRAAPRLGARVRFVLSPPWTTDRVTGEGREALRRHGLSPPGEGGYRLPVLAVAARPAARGADADARVGAAGGAGAVCPYCGSRDTSVDSAYGPTLCRSIHVCRSCRNPFEAFKTKGEGRP